ncbi:hypothetical protein [Halonotius roseus]|uniref:Uncharacterized protein n=1 Tax=Halonotius roseus TaxID=2511997 RepID=A0A544QR22_9EURY|nr:hypothetical protein [Halonotius roseus]TQQ81890.1 hypothetical protein EWF95_02830 [Halonotius roseus]
MSRNYDSYDDEIESNDDSDDEYDNEESKNLTVTPYAEIELTLDSVFGTSSDYGDVFGINASDVEIVDGCLYYDEEKDKYKVFSWKSVVGMNPGDGEFTADDANQFLVKTYGSTEKRYELIAAVHPDHDEPVGMGDAIMWYGGSQKHGPKSAAKSLAQILSAPGREMVIRDAEGDVSRDIDNWLADTSADNVLRDDLAGRRFAFFEIKKDSNTSDRKFHHPIVEDVKTGNQVAVNNSSTQSEIEDAGEAAAATDGGVPPAETTEGVPEPISDFISSVQQFDDFSEDRASEILADFIGDESLPLTQDLVDDFGGEEAVMAEAGY